MSGPYPPRVLARNTLGNLWFNLRGRDLWVTVYAAASLGRIGVFLQGKPEFYEKIGTKRKQIAAQIGAPVGWNPAHDHWSVGVSKKADPTNRVDWPRQHRWLLATYGLDWTGAESSHVVAGRSWVGLGRE